MRDRLEVIWIVFRIFQRVQLLVSNQKHDKNLYATIQYYVEIPRNSLFTEQGVLGSAGYFAHCIHVRLKCLWSNFRRQMCHSCQSQGRCMQSLSALDNIFSRFQQLYMLTLCILNNLVSTNLGFPADLRVLVGNRFRVTRLHGAELCPNNLKRQQQKS